MYVCAWREEVARKYAISVFAEHTDAPVLTYHLIELRVGKATNDLAHVVLPAVELLQELLEVLLHGHFLLGAEFVTFPPECKGFL